MCFCWPVKKKSMANAGSEKKTVWPPPLSETPFRSINDMVYGSIKLFSPVNLIVDTPEFQRLRRIKRLDVASLVYPDCDHSRFVHCLGVYHLARIFTKKLSELPELGITAQDRLCVAVAALCHDIGHGPFSKIFDEMFLPTVLQPRPNWTHKKGSVDIFRYICDKESYGIREALNEYLGPKDFIFIEELIRTPPECYDEKGKWIARGRDENKSFLYDIICNANDSLGVDKYDYLLRDAKQAGIAVPFNYKTFTRILDAARPLKCEDQFGNTYLRMCYAYKAVHDLDNVGQSRYALHDLVTNHRTVRACQRLLASAFKAAGPYLKFRGTSRDYTLEDVYANTQAFLKTTDSIYDDIANSTSAELEEARYYINCLQYRHLPKFVARAELGVDKYTEDSMKTAILKRINLPNAVDPNDIIVDIRHLHLGMGLTIHPMRAVLLYDHKKPAKDMKASHINESWLQMNPRSVAGAVSINVYISYEAKEKSIYEVVHKAFTEVIGDDGAVLPVYTPRFSVASVSS